jgi:phosphonate transport system substrate-binding protein
MFELVKPRILLSALVFCLLFGSADLAAQYNQNPDFPKTGNADYADYPEYPEFPELDDAADSDNAYKYLQNEGEDGNYSDQGSENYYGYDDGEMADDEIAGTESEPEPVEVKPARTMLKPGEPIKIEEKVIRVGRIPFMSIRQMMTQAVPLLRNLQKKTGAREVRLVSSGSSYSSILNALARGKIDFAWVGPTAYLKYRDQENLMAIAKARFGNDTAYRGVFIAAANGKVQGLEDLKGSRIGFVDPESASGYIYPMYLLRSLKINLGKNTKIAFLKNHDNVLVALLKGKIDAGACLEKTITGSTIKDLDKRIIVLAKTDEIPSDVIVCRQDCPINLQEKFREALVQIKPGELPGSPLTFLAATDEEFAPVEAVMRFQNLLK